MNTIIKNYNLQIKKFQKIESDKSESGIYDRRDILRHVFKMLNAFKINPSKVKNGEKAFKYFGKLHDIQVQLLKLESLEQTPEIKEYTAFLKEGEFDLKEKTHKFLKKKELEFPTIKNKSKFNKEKVVARTTKSFDKLNKSVQSKSIDDSEDIYEIRIRFDKFQDKVEILSYFKDIDESRLEMLKLYQDKFDEIQDYDILIKGIKKYCMKRKLDAEEMTELFEHEQNTLIENFDNQLELFIAVCKEVLISNTEVESAGDVIPATENPVEIDEKTVLNDVVEKQNGEQITNIMDSLVSTKMMVNVDDATKDTVNADVVENANAIINDENQSVEEEVHSGEKSDTDIIGPKSNSKKKRKIDSNVPLDSNNLN